MSEVPAKLRPRLFRFGLRSLFLVVAILCAWLAWNVHQVRERIAMQSYIVSQGGSIQIGPPMKPWKKMPLVWSLLGAQPVSAIQLPGRGLSSEDWKHIEPYFPEAELVPTQQMGGGMF